MTGKPLRGVLLALMGSVAAPAFGQSVVADGSTQTRVTISANGQVSVGIATADPSGVSMNRYERFSVPKVGVDLDNRTVRARTIVNEQTGPGETRLEGPLSVNGQRAHVIVANPNGVVVDGGQFLNTGQVVLGAGQISRNAREIAPGIFQDNVVLSTAPGGAVRIEGGGLSGQMDALNVMARSVKANGRVQVENDDPLSSINIVVGESQTEFDSSALPGNLGQPWARTTASAPANSGVVFELGDAGGLYGNRIQVLVTDQGAGVRMLGDAVAARQDFVLSSTGDVIGQGTNISAATGVSISGRSLDTTASRLHAKQGSVVTQTTGPTRLSSTQLEGQAIAVQAASGTLSGATLVSTTGDIVATTSGALSDVDGKWQSARSIGITTGAALSFDGTTMASGPIGLISLTTQGAFTARDSVVEADVLLTLTASSVEFIGATKQAAFSSARGAVVIKSEGDVRNTGTLVQGAQAVTAKGVEGAVTVRTGGSYLAQSATSTRRAVLFGRAGDVVVVAAGDIDNHNSRILANGNVKLTAAGDVDNSIDWPNGGARPAVIDTSTRDGIDWTLGILDHSTRTISYDYGTRSDPQLDAQVVASGGDVIVRADGMRVLGGAVTANQSNAGAGGHLRLEVGSLTFGAVASGKVSVHRDCNPFCRYKIRGLGADGISLTGGQLHGAAGIDVTAADHVLNDGGVMTSDGEITVTSPSITLRAIAVPFVVSRPGGLYNFWRSDAGWIYLRDLFGTIIADTGNVTLRASRPVRIEGGEITAKSVVAPTGMDIVRAPGVISPVYDEEIGWFHDVPPVPWD